jgi:tetratricopeptide (TPR) repeat protein
VNTGHHFFLAVLLSVSAVAQGTPPPAKPDYSQEAVVIEEARSVFRFENDGTGEQQQTSRVRVQTEAGVQALGVLRFAYDKATQDIQIPYVRVRKPDGKVVNTPLDSVQDIAAEVSRLAPIYSDLREKHVNVASLRPGDILESELIVRTKAALVPGQFWFEADLEKNAITLRQEIVLDVPADRKLKLKIAPGLNPETHTENGRKIYTWKGANLERKSPESGRKDGSRPRPAAENESPPPAVQGSTFQSWDEFGRWFSDIQRERITPTADVKTKAAELVRGLDSDEAKAQAVYDFVSKEIRYIGLEFGMGRYQANPASGVLANGYGDCKDKHTLLAAMLQAVGINASPVLIHSTRTLDPDVPSPSQFDHLFTVVDLGKRRVFLDSTAEVAPFGMLITVLRDKQALQVVANGAQIITTPAELPFEQFQKLEGTGKVDDKGNVSAEITQTFRGDLELALRLTLRHSGGDKFKDVAQGMAALTGFGGEVSNVTVSDLENTRVPLQVKYHYTRSDYLSWEGDTGTAKVLIPAIGLVAADTRASANSEPITLGSPIEIEYEGKLEYPGELTISEPRNVDMSRDYADYHSTYKLENNALTVTRSLKVKARKVPPEKRSDYAEFAKAVFNDGWQNAGASHRPVLRYRQDVSVPHVSMPSEKSSTQPGGKSTAQTPELIAAQGAYEEAGRALVQGDLFTARLKYKQALGLNPSHPDAWASMARLYMMFNDSAQAVSALRKQLEVNPQHPEANMILAEVLMFGGDVPGATKALKAQIEVNPEEGRAYTRLASLYMTDKKYKEAVPLLEKAAVLAPDDPDINLRLGAAYLETGENEKATAAYEKVLAGEPNPFTLNEIAYSLADHGVEVQRALEISKQAASHLEASLSSTQLAVLSNDDIRNTAQLLNTWDTVGWAYYKAGDLDNARSYLAATWSTMQNREIARHLSAVYERLGAKSQAAEFHTYAEAIPEPRWITLREGGHTYSWPKLGSSPQVASSTVTQHLQDMRTVRLSRRLNATEHADFFVLLSPAGVEDASFISGSSALESWNETLKTAKLPASFPKGAGGKIVRRGVLSCTSYNSQRMFVLLEPGQVSLPK